MRAGSRFTQCGILVFERKACIIKIKIKKKVHGWYKGSGNLETLLKHGKHRILYGQLVNSLIQQIKDILENAGKCHNY